MGRTDVSRVSLSVQVTSADVSTVSTHPWRCSVDSATYEALLSLNYQGVDIGTLEGCFVRWVPWDPSLAFLRYMLGRVEFVANHGYYFCHGVVDTFDAAVTTRRVGACRKCVYTEGKGVHPSHLDHVEDGRNEKHNADKTGGDASGALGHTHPFVKSVGGTESS